MLVHKPSSKKLYFNHIKDFYIQVEMTKLFNENLLFPNSLLLIQNIIILN